MELIPSGIELIAAYCKEQNLVDQILNIFQKGQKRSEYLKEMTNHITTQYSSKDIEDSSILFKIIDLRLTWLKQSTAVIPKFSWYINLSYPENQRVESFLRSQAENISFSGFSCIADARRFVDNLGLSRTFLHRARAGPYLGKYMTAEASGSGKSSRVVLRKTRCHFQEIENNFKQNKLELEKLVRWIGEKQVKLPSSLEFNPMGHYSDIAPPWG
jgi:hypothetical protein